MKDMLLEVKNLKKTYGRGKNSVVALKGISFAVTRGEVFGILGVNGAGKSTTLNILIGLLSSTSGSVNIFGKDFLTNEAELKARMNIATAYADLADNLTVQENFRVFSLLYGVREHQAKIRDLMEKFGIAELKNQRFYELSAGQKTRVNLCKSLLNDPELLLLDEPTASLDPSIAARVRTLLLDLQKKRRLTIIVTSHNMAEVEVLCDQVALLDQGRIYMVDTPENLTKAHSAPDLEDVFIRLAQGEFDE